MLVFRHFRALFCACTTSCACTALAGLFLLAPSLGAQGSDASGDSSADPAVAAANPPAQSAAQPDRRILGVIPNYKTINDPSQPTQPMSVKEKFKLGAKDSFDPHALPSIAFYAGIGQLEHQYESFGQGPAGFSKRFAGSYADQAIGNMLGEAIFPSLLHEDPRYFRMAHGTFRKRTEYALSRIFVIRMDDGSSGFNFSEYLGNGVQAAIS
ncbi:MAG TPA: hypothetical protein VEU62_19055, partial [Bryobacterales bacterium]|nr:hypothetical protein [Bryobacterales bacterium]